MPLENYGVLKGCVIDRRFASGANPHYQIHVVDESTDYRIAVNVQSQDGSEVEYVVEPWFRHPILDGIRELPLGFHLLPRSPGGSALDYIRGNLADPARFVPLPLSAPGPDNDLNEKLDQYVVRAMGDEQARIYAFGERWGPESGKKDKVFGFSPGNGIHDIHMNQGNDAKFEKDDGVWQDGGVVLEFPRTDQVVGIFLKFQSQAWHTDDKTGHRLGSQPDPKEGLEGGVVRIVAALVNDAGFPEAETVTLLNTSPRSIDLGGWVLMDKQKARMPLEGELGAGQCRVVPIRAPVCLSNAGGLVTLLEPNGLKVDGVSYTKQQASRPSWTIKF